MMKRLKECHKVLKPTGSIYLHCDYRASHYLKLIMDEIFGWESLRREIVYNTSRNISGFKSKANNWIRQHEVIFYYAIDINNNWVFNKEYTSWTGEQIKEFKHKDKDGRIYKEYGVKDNPTRQYLDKNPGIPVGDIWNDIDTFQFSYVAKMESVGYPTQKPVALLERIIKASSNEGDIVLDPFCGCGTALVAAHKLNRRWIGIDIHHKAFDVIRDRGRQCKLNMLVTAPELIRGSKGILEWASSLNPQEFEEWVNKFYSAKKPSPDRGVDGITKDGIAIQTKTFEIGYNVVSQFLSDAKYHPSRRISKPSKHIILVSQRGFDDSARQRAFEIESNEGIKVELLTPADMLNIIQKIGVQ